MKKLYLFVFSFFLLVQGFAQGKTYYVSPGGSDANNGQSSAEAWQTIARLNAFDFEPGDQVLFEGGATFTGTLQLQAGDAGSAGNPVVISSYGVGRAIIDAEGSGSGILAHNMEWIEVRDLIIRTKNSSDISHNGVEFFIDQVDRDLEHIVLDRLDISGFQGRGIFIWTGETDKGFSEVRITRCVTHENGMAGIETMGNWDDNWQASLFNHSDVYVGYCKAYFNYGVPTYTWNHSGSGIFVGGADGAVIEYSEAYENGARNGNPYAGPIGIWMAEIKNGIIQFCESYSNKGGVGPDGGGFDLDGGAQNCIIQYCYSHDNAGAGYALFEWGSANPFFKNIIRYNISQNDGRARGYSGLAFWGADNNHKVVDCEVYNNTIYTSTAGLSSGTPSAVKFIGSQMEGVKVRNNIFYVTEGVNLLDAPTAFSVAAVHFQNNTYYTTANQPSFVYGGSIYASLGSWKAAAAGQEMDGTKSLGSSADPLFINPGGGGIVHPSEGGDLTSLTAYRLQVGSRMIDGAMNLKAAGIDVGDRDFYNVPLTNAAAYDIGANEFDASFYSTLPLRFMAYSAEIKEGLLSVQWATDNSNNIKCYSVEVSPDGKNFETVKTYGVEGSVPVITYEDKLSGVFPERFFCRIKAVERSGLVYYSRVKSVQQAQSSISLRVYPNPATTTLTIQPGQQEQYRHMVLWSSSGTEILKRQVGNLPVSLDLRQLQPGVYYLELVTKNGEKKSIPVLKK